MKRQTVFGIINTRLYVSLLVMGLCPAVYTAVRIHFLGQMPDPWAYSIAGQLGWVNLIFEILQEAVLLPLFFFLGQAVADKPSFSNRVRSGLLLTACLYAALSLFLCSAVRPLLRWMAVEPAMLEGCASYIRLESIASSFGMLGSFALVALVTLGQVKALYLLTGTRLILSIVLDTLLTSALPFSLHLGVNGIGYSNLTVNLLLLAVSLWMLSREGVSVFSRGKLSFSWMREFFKVGGLSGLESFVRNIAYMLMVVRMVNVVQERGDQTGDLHKPGFPANPLAGIFRSHWSDLCFMGLLHPHLEAIHAVCSGLYRCGYLVPSRAAPAGFLHGIRLPEHL